MCCESVSESCTRTLTPACLSSYYTQSARKTFLTGIKLIPVVSLTYMGLFKKKKKKAVICKTNQEYMKSGGMREESHLEEPKIYCTTACVIYKLHWPEADHSLTSDLTPDQIVQESVIGSVISPIHRAKASLCKSLIEMVLAPLPPSGSWNALRTHGRS